MTRYTGAPILHFEENTKGKDYVVGDIHGCFAKLEAELEEIGFNPEVDRLFSVGDLVDRGAQSEEALDWLAKPWFWSVRGNHEQMAIGYVEYGDNGYYAYNGGKWMMDLPREHGKLFADTFKMLPFVIDIKVSDRLYGIVHAGPSVSDWNDFEEALTNEFKEAHQNVCMWSRDRINQNYKGFIENVELIYVGHTPLKDVKVLGNVIYIDTGACFGGKLTILEIY
jgi:serine/threonine protein phosphatase 1